MKRQNLSLAAIIWVALLIMLPTTNALGQTAKVNIRGVIERVSGNKKMPVSHARVWVHEQSGTDSFTMVPDQNGHFSLQLLPGTYIILVGAPGFAPYCKRIIVRTYSNDDIILKIQMGPDYENMED